MSEELPQGEWVAVSPEEEMEDLIITVPIKTAFVKNVDPSMREPIADMVAGAAAKRAYLHMMRRFEDG